MTKQRKQLWIATGVMAAILVLFALTLAWPLLTGRDVVLKTRPIDPYDPLRGQYMAINYEISSLPTISGAVEKSTVYVPLTQQGDIWVAGTPSLTEPSSGIFLKGEVTSVYQNAMRIHYGIEQYFVESGATVPTQNITVHAKVAPDGSARIVELLKDGKPVVIQYLNRTLTQ